MDRLEFVKAKYPNLTQENEQKFTKTLGSLIDEKLENSFLNCSISIDYEPCEELLLAFYSMDMSNFDSGLPIYDVFPIKTQVLMEKGKSARVFSEVRESGILYMSDEYRQKQKASISSSIKREESKIPQEIKDGFEQEYQTLMGAINIERAQLLRKKEEQQRILNQRKALELKAQQLIESYAGRVDELETLGLSESEKAQRKQDIIKEIQEIKEASSSNKYREQLGEIDKLLRECKEKMREFKLPIISDNYFVELNEANEAIEEVVKELSRKPIVIKTLNTRVDTARDLVLKLYNTTLNMINKAKLTEALIVYGNRYRSLHDDINSGLDRASSLFYKGNYDSALKLCIDTVKLVDDTIEGKIKAYESKI